MNVLKQVLGVDVAKKELVVVPLINETIPHEIRIKSNAAKLLLKPAPKGTGIKAGGAVRVELVHHEDDLHGIARGTSVSSARQAA